MPYELTATSVTSGLVIALGDVFPGVARYRETVPAQFLVYPYIFIHQLTLDSQTERRNHWMLSYLVNIRYHVAADPSLITGSLQQQLDDVSIQMMSDLTHITWDGIPVELRNRRTEKVDGILHFFANISVMATKAIEPDPLQESIDFSISQP
ncbi:MAG: phage tail terminator family protein [Sporomusa sp.]